MMQRITSTPNPWFCLLHGAERKSLHNKYTAIYFFLPFALLLGAGAWLEVVDMTLEAREEGAADVALLPAPDLTLSSALFCWNVSMRVAIIGR